MIKCNYNVHWDADVLATNMDRCLQYVERLRAYSKFDGVMDLERDRELLEKRESLQESINKILVNCKEEWRFVLTFMERFVEISIETLNGLTLPDDVQVFDMVLNFLHNLAGCIGIKRICRYWPTEVTWLTKLVGWLESYLSQNASLIQSRWSTLFTLILWLSAAVRTPFGLARFDVVSTTQQNTLASRIAKIINSTLSNCSLQPVLHRLAAGFYSRPDICCTPYLEQFVQNILENLSDSVPAIEKIGHLRILATMLETVERTVLLEQNSQVVLPIARRMLTMVDSSHELLTKLAIKILGRAALIEIPPRLVRWRYNCGKRIIALDQQSEKVEESSMKSSGDQSKDDENDQEVEDFQVELPDYFEQLIQVLLQNIDHSSTVVRYSVSKYLASICNRLPYRFSDQILRHICDELCIDTRDDLAWHGACLTLAEFVRRGFVPVPFLPKVVNVVERALFYEHIKGSFLLGAHVRDSAAYICWSLARAYDARLMAPFVSQLAPLLVCSACFDCDLNCRRAASAVIQELAGRTQLFPHWIEVIGATEFRQLSTPENTFLEIGVELAKFKVFQTPIVEHLVSKKLSHWDASIRRLAAQTLGRLAPVVQFSLKNDSRETIVVDQLCKSTINPDLNVRHGSILALANLFRQEPVLLENNAILLPTLATLIETLEKNSFFDGIGADYMREASLAIIENFCKLNSELKSPITSSTIESSQWNKFIITSIQSTKSIETEFVRTQLIRTCHSMLCSGNSKSSLNLLQSLCDLIKTSSSSQSIQIISESLQLLAYPGQYPVLEPCFESILTWFLQYIDRNFPNAQARNSESIASSLKSAIFVGEFYFDKLSANQQLSIYELLVRGLDDHTINNKGDSGQCVRIASIETVLMRPTYYRRLEPRQFLRIFQLISAEALFRRNRSFSLTVDTMQVLSSEIQDRVEQFSDIIDSNFMEQLTKLSSITIADELEDRTIVQYQNCVQLLRCSTMTFDILPGVVCVLADPIMEPQSRIIVDFLRNSDQTDRNSIFEIFLKFFAAKAKCFRLSIPCLVSARRLLLEIESTVAYRRQLATVSWSACESSSNPKKYLHACDVFCALIPLDPIANLSRITFPYLFVFLGHRIPRVRVYTATELFAALLAIDLDESEDPDQSKATTLMEISTLLQETDWLQADLAKKVRLEVRALIKSLDDSGAT